MSEAIAAPASKASGILKRKILGIPVIYLAIVFVGALALYAWRAKSSAAPADESTAVDEEAAADDGAAVVDGSLYPISPTGTVYAQAPTAVEDNVEYFGNDQWLQKAVAGLVAKGKNPGEVQNALQAYLAGEDMSYAQGLIRDEAVKAYGLPPESFRAGVSAAKPVATPKPTKPVVKPPTTPKPAPSKPVTKPTPKPAQKTHKVVKGDTLWDLAKKYYGNPTKWTTIANKNGIRNPKTLQIGKILVIP